MVIALQVFHLWVSRYYNGTFYEFIHLHLYWGETPMNYLVFFLLLLALSTLFLRFFVWSRFGSFLLWLLRELSWAFASVSNLWLVLFLLRFWSLSPQLVLFGEFDLGSVKHRLEDLSWDLWAFYLFLSSVLSANSSVFCTNRWLRSLIATSTLLWSTCRFRARGGANVFCNHPLLFAVVSQCLLTAKIW